MKRIFLFAVTLLTVCLLSVHAFAATGYIGYLKGNNEYDGKSAETPKKQFLGIYDDGVMSVIGQNGGTLVIVDRAYIGAHYTFPDMREKLIITAKYGDKSFVDAGNPYNPLGGVLKAAGGKTLTLGTDTVMTDMILFQEAEQNTLIVPSHVTLTITDSVQIMTKPGNSHYWKILLHENSTAILSEEALNKLEIVNRGGTVKVYESEFPKTVKTVVKMTTGNKTAYVNDEMRSLDATPIIRNGRTMLPVRFIANAFGAEVDWDSASSTAIVTGADGTVINITIGASAAKVNGEEIALDSPAFIENSRTYLPVRFVAHNLGATVEWDAETSTATLTREAVHIPKVDLAKFETPKGHSEFYLDGYTTDQIITYFNEVCLDTESKVDMGNTNIIQKWTSPIYYKVYSNYTDEDIKVIADFAKTLNAIEGFPGMYEATNSASVNLPMYYCDQNELIERMGEEYANVNGVGRYWYNGETNAIGKGIICYSIGVDIGYRNRLTLHEIYNIIGAPNDSKVRTDSIIYQYGIQAENLTELDLLILKLLYNPKIKCGMNASQCETVIRELYY